MPTTSTLAAGSSLAISLAAGSSLSLSGYGTAQIAPPVPQGLDRSLLSLVQTETRLGPFPAAVSINVVALGAVTYYTTGDSDVPNKIGQQAFTVAQVAALAAKTNTSGLQRWKSALALRAAGTRNAKLLIISDSTGTGVYATGASYGRNDQSRSWPNLLAPLFNAAGLPANTNNCFSDTTGQFTSAAMATQDTRMVFGANWICAAFYTIGGQAVTNSTAGSVTNFNFTPVDAFDTITVTYVTVAAYGKFSVSVDGGADLSGTVNGSNVGTVIDCNAATAVKQAIFTCALGTHVVNIHRSASTGADGSISILSVQTSKSTVRTVEILNASVGGSQTTIQSDTAAAYSTLSAGQIYAPDLTIIGLDINDWVAALTPGTYDLVATATHSAQLQKIITAYKATGDVILMTGCPSITSSYTQAAQNLILTATRTVAAANNVPLVDVSREWGNYVYGLAAGYYLPQNDVVHPGLNGYTNIAALVGSVPGIFGGI